MADQTVVSLEFKKFVVQEVSRHWLLKGEPILLAKLGQAAASRGFILQTELQGLKLSQFIQQELSEELEVLSPDDSGTVLRIKPKNPPAVEITATPDPDVLSLGALNRALVAAFSHAVPDGVERWIKVQSPVHYTDIATTDDKPKGYVQIDRAHLVTPDRGIDAFQEAHVLRRISDWTRELGMDLQMFVHKAPNQERGEKTLLSLLMESLTESELKRISLPLDIVGKLMRK